MEETTVRVNGDHMWEDMGCRQKQRNNRNQSKSLLGMKSTKKGEKRTSCTKFENLRIKPRNHLDIQLRTVESIKNKSPTISIQPWTKLLQFSLNELISHLCYYLCVYTSKATQKSHDLQRTKESHIETNQPFTNFQVLI